MKSSLFRQISTDALRSYVDSLEQVLGTDVDFGQIVKNYEPDHSQHPEHKYSAPKVCSRRQEYPDRHPCNGFGFD